MDTHNHLELLPRLGAAIDTSLASWEAYLSELEGHPVYHSIISEDPKDAVTKAKALQYLLSTLPSRHKALVRACCDPDITSGEIPDVCGNLLDELQSSKHDIDLTAWFNTFTTSKRFVDRVRSTEADLAEEEQRRRQELSRLKAIHIGLTQVSDDGELKPKDVEALLDAMEAVGVLIVGEDELDTVDVKEGASR